MPTQNQIREAIWDCMLLISLRFGADQVEHCCQKVAENPGKLGILAREAQPFKDSVVKTLSRRIHRVETTI